MRSILLLIFIGLGLVIKAQTADDASAIEQTLNSYIDGFYKGDATKLKKALKPRLYKFGYLKNKETGAYEFYQQMTFDQAIDFVNKMKEEGRTRDETEIRKAEILDIGNHIASAKITAVWGVDYVLLSKDNGQWMIEQVIWEGPYIKENKKAEVTTYYLIRHAEKDRSNPDNQNPQLTEAGQQRAEKWAQTFKNIPLDAVYSTNYQRTLQTALPTASLKNLEVKTYNPGNMDMQAFYQETEGKHILIVGHSNTTPNLVNTLLGESKYKNMNDTDNSGLFIVTVSKFDKSSTLLHIE